MKAVTIREAKARLNALVEAAERGEQIVLMRGSKRVAAIVPLSADDLELVPTLTDAQADRFWRQLHEERQAGTSIVFDSPERAEDFLRSVPKGADKPGNRDSGKRLNRARHR
jgi:prevent-host-death family protein